MCVQRFDDSLNSAIHTTYRISLRSSSMPEPRDPLLKVLTDLVYRFRDSELNRVWWAAGGGGGVGPPSPAEATYGYVHSGFGSLGQLSNDPSAGSPTETLLRLLLPLNDRVWMTFRP